MATGEVNYRLKSDSGDFVAGVEKAERSVKGLDKEQKRAAKSADGLGKQSASINKLKGAFMGLGSVVAGLGITAAFKKMVDNTARQEAALVQLNTTLNSTQFAAGKTADELTRTAAELQKVTKFGDEAIIEMQALLLTFKDIKGDNFDRTSEAILDMATAMNVDLKSATIQLGKALNDPARNLSALTRSGIQFNEQQTEMIKQMQASGDMAGAQALILAELESQFGNSAKAARDTLGGALAGLSNAWNDLFEAEKQTSASLVKGINSMEKAITSKGFKDGLNLVIESLKVLFGWIGKVYEGWYKLGGLLSNGIAKLREWGLFKDDLDKLGEALVAPVDLTGELVVATGDATDAMEELAEITVTATRKNFDLGDSVDRASDALKHQKEDLDALQEVTVTATRRNTEFADTAADAAEETASSWSRTGSVMADFFSDLVTDGKNAFGNLLQSFGNMLVEMAAQAAANKILLNVGASVTGTAISAGANAAAGAGGGLLAAGGGGALAGALSNPLVLGGIVLGGLALNSIFGEDNNGNNAGAADFDLGTGLISGRGIGKSFDQKNVTAAEQIAETLLQISEAVGGSTFSGKVKVGNNGVKLNGQEYGSPEELIDAAFVEIVNSATNLSDGLKDLILGFEGTTEETLKFAGAVISLTDNAAINTVTQAIEDFANANPTLGESLIRNINSVEGLLTAYDGTAESADNLAQAFAQNKALAYEFATAIQTIGKEISAVATEQAEYIRESILTADELREKRTQERDALRETLDSITNPEELARVSQRILELNRQVFDSLTEDQKLEQSETFAQIAEDVNATSQDILNESLDRLQASQEDMNQRVSQMLADAAAQQQGAAQDQLEAARINQESARKNEQNINTLLRLTRNSLTPGVNV
jgi:phage-related minor tail protein